MRTTISTFLFALLFVALLFCAATASAQNQSHPYSLKFFADEEIIYIDSFRLREAYPNRKYVAVWVGTEKYLWASSAVQYVHRNPAYIKPKHK